MEPKRVVITGMGVISSVGQDVDTFWKNLCNGYCGIDYVEEFKDMPVTFAGKVKDFNAENFGMEKPFIRKQDNFTLYAMAAAWQAMQQSGLVSEGENCNIDPFRLGVYVGSGIFALVNIGKISCRGTDIDHQDGMRAHIHIILNGIGLDCT